MIVVREILLVVFSSKVKVEEGLKENRLINECLYTKKI